jgi:hypothetical protein
MPAQPKVCSWTKGTKESAWSFSLELLMVIGAVVRIRAGYDIAFQCPQAVPMILMLSVHPSRQSDLLSDHAIRFSPGVNSRDYRDAFGNICTRLVAPAGLLEIRNEFSIQDTGLPDEELPSAQQWEIERRFRT